MNTNQNIIVELGHFYDMGTKNVSFLDVSEKLRMRGVTNNKFMLEVKDPSVIGLDPYSPNLSDVEKEKIKSECESNIWYYLREVCRIPSQGGVGVPYKANRGNIAQTWLFTHGTDSWLCLPRQTDMTTSCLAILVWLTLFAVDKNDACSILTPNHNNALYNKTMDCIELLPAYLREFPRDIKTIGFDEVAKNSVLCFDDAEFIKDIDNLINTTNSYYRIFNSAVNKHRKCPVIEFGLPVWTEGLYDVDYDPNDDEKNELLQYVKMGRSQIIYISYNVEDLQKGDEWLNEMRGALPEDVFNTEALLQMG